MIDVKPLAVFAHTIVCDGRCEREFTLYTDGISAYVVAPLDSALNVAEGIERVDLLVATACPVEHCHGWLSWMLNTAGAWTADPEALAMLNHAGPLERA